MMDEDLPEAVKKCLDILEENVEILANLEFDLEDLEIIVTGSPGTTVEKTFVLNFDGQKIFEDKIEKFIVQPNIERIKEYLRELDK